MVVITEDHFDNDISSTSGIPKPIRRFTLQNNNNVTVQVITLGATITSIKIPDKYGVVRDVIGGYLKIDGYLQPQNPKFGAIVGRSANYIKSGVFKCHDKIVHLSTNQGFHHLDGGFVGFDKVIWDAYAENGKLILSYNSRDLEEGYPGNLLVNVKFLLDDMNKLTIFYKARTTKPTFVNLTHNLFFNMGGFSSGDTSLRNHLLYIQADKVLQTDRHGIATGEVALVDGTGFDFQTAKYLGDVGATFSSTDGLDHILSFDEHTNQIENPALRLSHSKTGRVMEICTNQPCVRLYTANCLPMRDKDAPGDWYMPGNCYKHETICIAPQGFPNSPNIDAFPSSLCIPGSDYHRYVSYTFSTMNK